ncbi:hypothetical protein [Sciscionella marina]|uniref:baeRF2 domain-containing protein n=1 Tax=Sciscionella marina TaxID=508770 RepID=UPI000374794E|nr:hypothetical protein [Sciscionella marina]
MDLSNLRGVYEHDGPFASVYLEGRSPGEDSAEQMRLRWHALRERLAEAGATETVLDALDAELGGAEFGEEQANGRVLVAAEDGVVLNEPWDAALGSGDDAHWTIVPELGSYARELARSVRLLVAVCDAHGAQLISEVVAEQHEPREVGEKQVEGSGSDGVHKPRGGALSHNQIQRHADETVRRNAKDIVEALRKTASRFRPRVIVLAGEVQARTAVRQQLTDDIAEQVIETDSGGRDKGASEEALAERLLVIAGEHATAGNAEHAERFNTGLAHGQAVDGNEQVAKAAELGAVDTLLYEDETPASREAFLLKVCAETGSAFGLVAKGTGMTDGVGALLRYPIDS